MSRLPIIEFPMSQQSAWKEALRLSMPVGMGYVPAAIAFGVLMSAAGLPWWWALQPGRALRSGAMRG